MMSKKVIVGIIIAAVVIVGAIFFLRGRGGGGPEEEQPEEMAVKVERGSLEITVSASGVLEPLTTVEVKPRAGGVPGTHYTGNARCAYRRAGEEPSDVPPLSEGQGKGTGN